MPIPLLFVFAYEEEARPFKEKYLPKHLFSIKNIQCFCADSSLVYMLITGSGFYSTSVAVSVFFERYPHLKKEILCFNIGIAGSYSQPLYSVFYAAKITNYHTQQSIYPDIFIKTQMCELISIEHPASEEIMQKYPTALFDMEGYSFAKATGYFIKNHQIHCIKFVSDHNGYIPDMFELLHHYHQKSPYILDLVQNIQQEAERNMPASSTIHKLSSELSEKIAQHLKLTQSQQHQLYKALVYHHLHRSNVRFDNLLRQIEKTTAVSKHQRNQYFQKILNELYYV